jgi:hypothetical protein
MNRDTLPVVFQRVAEARAAELRALATTLDASPDETLARAAGLPPTAASAHFTAPGART